MNKRLLYQIGGGIVAALVFFLILASIKWIILGLVVYIGVIIAGRYYSSTRY